MSKTSTFAVAFRRRREGRTNYVKRLAFMKSGVPRAVIRKSTNHLSVQFVQTQNGKDFVLASGHTQELRKYEYVGHTGNIPAAYLAGYLAGKRFSNQKTTETIVDIGTQRNVLGTRLFAAVKGIKDAGISIRADEESFPKPERVMGKHIESLAKATASKTNAHSLDLSRFSGMVEASKRNIDMGVRA